MFKRGGKGQASFLGVAKKRGANVIICKNKLRMNL